MGREYAGILGLLAFLTVVTRGLARGAGAESTLLAATVDLIVFACVGYFVGQLAGWIVFDSVRAKLAPIDRRQPSTTTPR